MSYKTRCWLTIAIMFAVCVPSSLYLGICAVIGVYFGTRIAYKYRSHAPYFDRNPASFYGTLMIGLGIMFLGIAVNFPPVYGVGLMIFESIVFMKIAYDTFGD